MRLGGQDIIVKAGTKAFALYRDNRLMLSGGVVRERFRHRYELNPSYREILEENGLVFSGWAPNQPIMQILEITDHPFFIGVQYHPEFTSRPMTPNPLFRGFIEACLRR